MSAANTIPPIIDHNAPGFGDIYDELPLWSAPFGQLMLESVPLRPGLHILDAGSGTGFLSLELAQRCGPQSKVMAVDPWTECMNRLRHKAAQIGVKNIEYHDCSLEEVQVADESIDLVVSNLGLNNFEHPSEALLVCRRVLKPNGVLCLTTNLVGHMQEFYDIYETVLRDLDLEDSLPRLAEHVAHRGTIASLSELLVGSGFSEPKVSSRSFVMRFADGQALLNHFLIRLGFLPAWRTLVPEKQWPVVRGALVQALDRHAQEHGEVCLTVPMACLTSSPCP